MLLHQTLMLATTGLLSIASALPTEPVVDEVLGKPEAEWINAICSVLGTEPQFTGYRVVQKFVAIQSKPLTDFQFELHKCEDGASVLFVPYKADLVDFGLGHVSDRHRMSSLSKSHPYTKLLCSGTTCYKMGRTVEEVLKSETSLIPSPDKVTGGLFLVTRGDGSQDRDLTPVAPLITQPGCAYNYTIRDPVKKEVLYISYATTTHVENYLWNKDGDPWYTKISANEKYVTSESTRSAFRRVFERQVLFIFKSFVKLFAGHFLRLSDDVSDKKPIRKAMKSVNTAKIEQVDLLTRFTLKDSVMGLARGRINKHLIDMKTYLSVLRAVPRAEVEKLARRLSNVYSKIPINPGEPEQTFEYYLDPTVIE